VSITVKKTSSEPFPSSVGIGFSLTKLAYEKILGYLGSIKMPTMEVDLPIDFFDDNPVNDAISVDNPILSMEIINDYQIGVGLAVKDDKLDIDTKNNGVINVTGLTLPQIQPAPNSTTPWEGSGIVSTALSPSIVDVIQKNPTNIHFFLNAWLRASGGNEFTIKHDDVIKVKTALELPLSIKANRFQLHKNLEFKVVDIPDKDSIIDKVEIKLTLDNSFPLKVEMQAGFIDPATGKPIRNLVPDDFILIESGEVGSPSSKTSKITISGNEWHSMAEKGVDEIVLKFYFSTPDMARFYHIKGEESIHTRVGAKVYTKAK
jgi:hypothetical protein